MQHPISKETLERFAAGKASPDESRGIVAHLLKGCETCARILRELERVESPVCAYDKALDRFERDLRGELQAPSGRLTVLRAVLTKFEDRLLDVTLLSL